MGRGRSDAPASLPNRLLAQALDGYARDRGVQIALPSIFAIGSDGVLRYVYVGQDFADRSGDDEVHAALAAAAGEEER